MKSIAMLGIGTLLGFGTVVGVMSAKGADTRAYRQLDLFSEAFEKVRANYERPVDDSELISSAIQGMVSQLDPHSRYMDAKAYSGDFQVTTTGQFGGIGVLVAQDDGHIKVISLTDGMPA